MARAILLAAPPIIEVRSSPDGHALITAEAARATGRGVQAALQSSNARRKSAATWVNGSLPLPAPAYVLIRIGLTGSAPELFLVRFYFLMVYLSPGEECRAFDRTRRNGCKPLKTHSFYD